MNHQPVYRTEEEIEAIVANLPDDLKESMRVGLLKEKAMLDKERDNESEEVKNIIMEREKLYSGLDGILSVLPGAAAKKLKNKITEIVDYEPTVGIFGTTGVGKSALINRIFGKMICKTSSVAACTRQEQKVPVNFGGSVINFIDLPGFGETNDRDEEYAKLYCETLPKLDIVLWAIKADDRAFAVAQSFYNEIIIPNQAEEKVIFVITQVDKIETEERFDTGFDRRACRPSLAQIDNIEIKKAEIKKNITEPKNKIVAVSAKEGYNIGELIEVIINALPDKARPTVCSSVAVEFQTDRIKKTAEQAIHDHIKKEREKEKQQREEEERRRREEQRAFEEEKRQWEEERRQEQHRWDQERKEREKEREREFRRREQELAAQRKEEEKGWLEKGVDWVMDSAVGTAVSFLARWLFRKK